ncbi:MAG: response regulator, partial [Cyanobacteria bacterium J149]
MSTVLLVEDSIPTRKMIAEILTKQGFNVEVATDGIQALEVLPNLRPDLVILDIIMPKMNGYEVCRKIKSDPQTKDLPVIICSSKGEDFDRYWG